MTIFHMSRFALLFLLCLAGTWSPSEEPGELQTEIESELLDLERARTENPELTMLNETTLKQLTGRSDVREVLESFIQGKKEADKEWGQQQASIHKIANLGETAFLEILPLVDFYSGREDLKTEAAVSYLVKTETNTVLFDLGGNSNNSHPSPLLQNMQKLGVSLEDVDSIVISHNHGDHTGGGAWSGQNTFSLTATQIPLGEKKVYTPVPMTYPGIEPIYSAEPIRVAQGVATSGTIANQMFFMGRIEEQALAVNVSGKGIVLILGCGHQTLPRVLERAEALFDQPIYGLVGGLHYAVTTAKGIGYKYMGNGRVPWKPYSMEDISYNINMLKIRDPKLVGVSPHDSCDDVIAEFRNAFGEAYRSIEVGKKISIR